MSQPASERAAPVARLVVGGAATPKALPQRHAAAPPPNAIGTFIELEMEARQCRDVDSLRFAIVNSTRKLAAFDHAYFVQSKPPAGWRVACASSVQNVDRHAPAVRFIETWLAKAATAPGINASEPRFTNLALDAATYEIAIDAPDCAHAFWLPIKGRDGQLIGALVALKAEPWKQQMVSMLIPLAGAYAHAWQALQPKSPSAGRTAIRFLTKSRLAVAMCSLAALAAFIPVPLSSLAPAEIVARNPVLVTAPIDGVIAEIMQPPGAMVSKGTPLLAFADVNLRNTHEVAKRKRDVAQARYFKIVQTVTAVQKEVEELAIAKAELDVADSELAYAAELLKHRVLVAEQAGLLIYSGKSDWIGRPVATGERIMEIGNPAHTEIRIEVPVSDALTLAEGGDVALFLDGDPLTPVQAKITRANYRPASNGEHQLVYKVHATQSEAKPHRIGLRGVARVSSHNVPLAFYLFRRPIAGIRQRFGL